MKDTIKKILALNKQKKTLQQIADALGFKHASYISRLISNHPNYIPGPKGFAAFSKQKKKKVSIAGGKVKKS
jgi:hypothetical protein